MTTDEELNRQRWAAAMAESGIQPVPVGEYTGRKRIDLGDGQDIEILTDNARSDDIDLAVSDGSINGIAVVALTPAKVRELIEALLEAVEPIEERAQVKGAEDEARASRIRETKRRVYGDNWCSSCGFHPTGEHHTNCPTAKYEERA